MTKIIKGSCNWCGHCGCYDPDGKNKWCPGIGYHLFPWDDQHPELGLKIVKEIKKIVDWPKNKVDVLSKITIPRIGKINFYLSKEGLQTSETDRSCPFFDKATHECKIYNTDLCPPICKELPVKSTTDNETITKWEQNHPSCGFYWEDK